MRWWSAIVILVGAAVLASVLVMQFGFGLWPCELCVKERWVWVAAIVVAGLGLAFRRRPALANGAIAFVFLAGAVLAGYHAGVEWKFWPGPAACTGIAKVSAADIAALLNGARGLAPQCDRPALVVLGLSLAAWNAALSLVMAIVSACAALRRPT